MTITAHKRHEAQAFGVWFAATRQPMPEAARSIGQPFPSRQQGGHPCAPGTPPIPRLRHGARRDTLPPRPRPAPCARGHQRPLLPMQNRYRTLGLAGTWHPLHIHMSGTQYPPQEIAQPLCLCCPGCGPRLAHTDTFTSLLVDADPLSPTTWTPTSGMEAVRIASPGVVDEAARFLEATAPAINRAPEASLLSPLLCNPLAPVQLPCVCGPMYGLGPGKELSIDALAVLDGVADDARRAELEHLYRCVNYSDMHIHGTRACLTACCLDAVY